MNKNSYYQQVELLLKTLPYVGKRNEFALKGGTAINLFVRDMPRLSVDIDLTYLPIEGRDTALSKISHALQEIEKDLKKTLPQLSVQKRIPAKTTRVNGLLVRNAQGAQIKIEANEIIRGAVFPCEVKELSKEVQKYFGMFLSMQTLSFADLYGGKICAALDRQHPRDLFDIKILFDKEGLTDPIRKAFIVYLASHNRPIHELFNPVALDFSLVFKNEFSDMMRSPVSYEDLLGARKQLISQIKKQLTDDERKFLLSVKLGEPDWPLLKLSGIENLPAIQWKIANIRKMDSAKHKKAVAKLKETLEL